MLIPQTFSSKDVYGKPLVGTSYTGRTASGSTGQYLMPSIGIVKGKHAHIPPWIRNTGESKDLNYPKNGYIAGTVTINTIPQQDVIVRLHRVDYSTCLQETRTNVTGQYRFNDLNPALSDYYLVYLSPQGTPYNNLGDSGLTPSVD